MKYHLLNARIGDVLRISDALSLRFERIADDLSPAWFEIPAEEPTVEAKEGDFVQVTNDIWFVLENGHWRMMNQDENLRIG